MIELDKRVKRALILMAGKSGSTQEHDGYEVMHVSTSRPLPAARLGKLSINFSSDGAGRVVVDCRPIEPVPGDESEDGRPYMQTAGIGYKSEGDKKDDNSSYVKFMVTALAAVAEFNEQAKCTTLMAATLNDERLSFGLRFSFSMSEFENSVAKCDAALMTGICELAHLICALTFPIVEDIGQHVSMPWPRILQLQARIVDDAFNAGCAYIKGVDEPKRSDVGSGLVDLMLPLFKLAFDNGNNGEDVYIDKMFDDGSAGDSGDEPKEDAKE